MRHLAVLAAAVVLCAGCATVDPPDTVTAGPWPTTPTGDTLPADPSLDPTATPADTPEVRAASVEREARNLTLRVSAVRCDGVAKGSAWALDATTVITNRHVIDDATTVTLATWDGRDVTATVTGVAAGNDLAILTPDTPLGTVARLGPLPDRDDPVTAVGYPSGNAVTFTTGDVVRIAPGFRFGETGPIIRATAEVIPGNSGGPLLNAAGDVVGVVYAYEETTLHSLAIPVDSLVDLIDSDGFTAPAPVTCGASR